jgi:sporulation protein YlmC with PRC-barrel domain
MTLTLNEGADVFTADGQRVGSVDRIVLDPLTKDVSHIVVRRGVLFREDKVIPTDMIATTDEEQIVLDTGVSGEDIPPFEERHYVTVLEEFYQPDLGSVPPLLYFGPYALATPVIPTVTETVRNRDIPDRAVAVETGAKVVTSDGEAVGALAQVLMTDGGVATHLVVDVGSFMFEEYKGVPMGWIESIDDDVVRLGVPKSMIEAIPEYGTDRDTDFLLT